MSIAIGKSLPAIKLAATGDREVDLKSYKGKPLVLYFYPKDNTSGCTLEGQDFTALYPEFQRAGVEIVGVSRDSVRSHENFCSKYGFPFTLLSDPDERLCNALDVMKEKSMYGRTYMGVDRSTFLFGADGKLKRQWRGVKVKGHAAEVLEAAQSL